MAMTAPSFALLTDLNTKILRLLDGRPGVPDALDGELLKRFPSLAPRIGVREVFVHVHADTPGVSLYAWLARRLADGRGPTFDQALTTFSIDPVHTQASHLIQGLDAVGVEKWLEDCASALERLYLTQLRAYWTGTAPDASQARHRQLRALHMERLKAELALRRYDKTLPTGADQLIQQVLDYPRQAQRAHLDPHQQATVYRVSLQGAPDVPMHAAFVITRDDWIDGSAVLYTAVHGIEAFEHFDDLDALLRQRLSQSAQRDALLYHAPNEARGRLLSASPITPLYSLVESSLFDDLVEGQLQKMIDDVRDASRQAQADGSASDLMLLATQWQTASDLSQCFDLSGIQTTRNTALWTQALPSWLRDADSAQQQQWRTAWQALAAALQAAIDPALLPIHLYGQRQTVLDHAWEALRARLKERQGLDLDPDQVFITTTSAWQTGALSSPASVTPSSYAANAARPHTGPAVTLAANQRTLTQLALENVGLLDVDYLLTARVHDRAGSTLAQLSPAQVRAHVRGLDFANSYVAQVRQALLGAGQGQWRQQRFVAIWQAQFRLDALEAKLAKDLTADRHSDLDTLFDGTALQAHHLVIDGVTCCRLWIIAPADLRYYLLYCPDAASGRRFHEYSNAAALHAALAEPDMRRDLVARVPHPHQADTQKRLGTGSPHWFTLKHLGREPAVAEYQAQVEAALLNARALATSTHDTNVSNAFTVMLLALDVITAVLPVKVLIPLALTRSLWSIGKGLQALNAQDRDAALAYFMGAIAHLTDASSDLAGSKVFSTGARPGPTLTGLDGRYAVKPPKGLRPRTDPGYEGLWQSQPTDGSPPQLFVEQGGRHYEARRQPHNDAWYVLNPRNPHGSLGQPIQRDAGGQWRQHWVDRLPGGAPTRRDNLWDANSGEDAIKDIDTLNALRRVAPRQSKATIEHLLRSFNMPKALRDRLAADVRLKPRVPDWAADYRKRSMNPNNPARFDELRRLSDAVIEALRRSGRQPITPEARRAVANFSTRFLHDYALSRGYRLNSQHAFYRTDLPAVMRGDSRTPFELARDDGLLTRLGSHPIQFTSHRPVVGSLNYQDALHYSRHLQAEDLAYNYQTDLLPAGARSLDEGSGSPGGSASPDSLSDTEAMRLEQQDGFVYLFDTRGLETVPIADNFVLNPYNSTTGGFEVAAEVHISVLGGPRPDGGLPAERIWLVDTTGTRAARIDHLDRRFGKELGALEARTHEGDHTLAEYDRLIAQLPATETVALDVNPDGTLASPPFSNQPTIDP